MEWKITLLAFFPHLFLIGPNNIKLLSRDGIDEFTDHTPKSTEQHGGVDDSHGAHGFRIIISVNSADFL